jgi:hypothetical protein
MSPRERRIVIESGEYAIVRGDAPPAPQTDTPEPARSDGRLRVRFSGAGESSGVFPEDEVDPAATCTTGWRWLRVIGPLDLSEIGILASIAAPLARAEIPIFVVSSFETDHLLIRAPRLEAARQALEEAGWTTEDAAPPQDVE